VIKVMASGGANTVGSDMTVPQFSIEELRLLVEQAQAAGLPVTAHAHAAAAVDQAIAVGVQGIEHAAYLVPWANGAGSLGWVGLPDMHATDAQLAALAASAIPVCPTTGGSFVSPPPHVEKMLADAGITREQVLEKRMSLLRRMVSYGVRLVCGADAGIGPSKAHGRYADAVIELGQVTGTVPALVAGSSGAAASIGLGRSKGRLRPGYDADVLVVGGDLAADLTALWDVRQVVLRGVPVSRRSRQS
jgi:imidazolonepropionase-like amidohydrolase